MKGGYSLRDAVRGDVDEQMGTLGVQVENMADTAQKVLVAVAHLVTVVDGLAGRVAALEAEMRRRTGTL